MDSSLEVLKRRVAELEEALEAASETRRTEKMARFAISRAGESVFWLDSEARLVYVNEGACRSLGYSRDELLRLTVHDLDPGFPEEAWPAHWQEVKSRGAFTVESRHRRKDGTLFPVDVSVNFLIFEGKEYNCAFVRDTTERKKAEEELAGHRRRLEELVDERTESLADAVAELQTKNLELEEKNAELERFSYAVSHDLKSPLITIRGFLGFLQKDMEAGNFAAMRGDLERIQEATEKMARLIEELLELSRVGRLVNEPEELALAEIAREAASLVAGRIAQRGVEVDVSPDLPRAFGDRLRILEVFQNLIDNAVKFMGDEPRPRVAIGARYVDGEAVFYVRDNGIGIDPSYAEKIFELFERLEQDDTESTGIGLALVRRIIEHHGGRIWVESEGAGRGSTFCFTLAEPSP